MHFGRFVRYHKPDFVLVENVPGLQKITSEDGPLPGFIKLLKRLRYFVAMGTIDCCDYGVPQKRKRFVLLASKLGAIELPPRSHGLGTENPVYSTVGEWISGLPEIAAGESCPSIKNHRASNLSLKNLTRIRATPVGGGREDWPKKLKLKCHKDHDGHSDVYGRLRADLPASALTTRCISLSNGRFGHPTQARAISVREAAKLQTFDDSFEFLGSLNSMARQIGNAVPVLLARRLGEAFLSKQRAIGRECEDGHLEARARALDMLGRQQIAGVPTAINELFKNAHDAYADKVEVDFYRSDGLFLLRDDGVGMSRADFESRWLTLGTESKVNSTVTGMSMPKIDPKKPVRPILGEKGIGRLAIAVLGPQVLVLTRSNEADGVGALTAAFVQWTLFQCPGINLDQIDVPIRTFDLECFPEQMLTK